MDVYTQACTVYAGIHRYTQIYAGRQVYSATGLESKMPVFLIVLCVLACILLITCHGKLKFCKSVLKDVFK